jgi:hypothetical protein
MLDSAKMDVSLTMKCNAIKDRLFQYRINPSVKTPKLSQQVHPSVNKVSLELMWLGHSPANPSCVRLAHATTPGKDEGTETSNSGLVSKCDHCI